MQRDRETSQCLKCRLLSEAVITNNQSPVPKEINPIFSSGEGVTMDFVFLGEDIAPVALP